MMNIAKENLTMEDNTKEPKHVMISYQWDSQKQVIKLRDKLKQEGYKIWMDIDKMEAEYAFTKNIPVIPLKVDGNFEPSSWLGLLVGAKLYYCIETDELLHKNFTGLIRDLGVRGRLTAGVSKLAKTYTCRARKALECSVCLERYRNPKTLPCLHSLCRDCLLRLAPFGSLTVSCPQCREKATVPDGDATKFKSNFHLQELIEEEATQEHLTGIDDVDISKSFTCTCCDAEAQSKVVAKCQDCNHYLCDSALDAHQRFPALRKHGVLVFKHTNEATESKFVQRMPLGTTDKPTELQTAEWEIFDALYNEDHSGYLLKYWIQRNGGGRNWQTTMVDQYTKCLRELEEDGVIGDAALLNRQEQVARVFMQAGQCDKSITLVQKTIDVETKELGARPDKLADLYGLASSIYLEISKQEDYISDSMLPTLRDVIRYARKSIKLRKSLEGDDHKYKLGKMLLILTLALSTWIECGCDAVLLKRKAVEESKRHINCAIQIFRELDTKGNLADAMMAKAYFAEGDVEKKLYTDAHKLCLEVYGECSVLTSRLNLNIGIMYERRHDFHQAYKWFVKCGEITEKVYGYHHAKTERSRRILEEPQYVEIKKQLSVLK